MPRHVRASRWFFAVAVAASLLAVGANVEAAGSPGPGSFVKVTPTQPAVGLPATPTLSWSASSGATSYEYCLNAANYSTCTTAWVSVGNALSVALPALAPGATYSWQVRAWDNSAIPTYANGTSDAYWLFRIVNVPPMPFSRLSPAQNSMVVGDTVIFRWTFSSDATRWEYCLDTTDDNACTNWTDAQSESAGIAGLPLGTQFYWHARARQIDSPYIYVDGSSTAFWTFTTVAPGSPPPPAPGLFVKAGPANGTTIATARAATLSWSPSDGANWYEYCLDTTNDNQCATWRPAGNALAFEVGDLMPGTTYYWQVRATRAGSPPSYADTSVASYWRFTTGSEVPGPFARVSPADGATAQPTNPTLSWTASVGATSYEFCVDTINDGACNNFWIPTPNLNSPAQAPLPGTTYYWQVRAANAQPTRTYADGTTAFRSFTTVQGPPGPFGKLTFTPQVASLVWTPSQGATLYEYCIDTTNDDACSTWIPVGTSNGAGADDLLPDTTYYWQVRASNSFGPPVYANGSPTAFQAFTTPSYTGALSLNPERLTFFRHRRGTAVTDTPGQDVTVSFSGIAPRWTARSNMPWLWITNASRPGSGTFTVSIDPAATFPAGVFTATVTLRSMTAPPIQLPVTLRVGESGGPPIPAIGQVDTPQQNATDQVGAIGVTGWAVDDVGVMSVKIYRRCLAVDNASSCQTVLGNNVVFIGDAAFVSGARPDVEAAFPDYPLNYRAGWGAQILTLMLPHGPNGQLIGGQGTIDLLVFATDAEGNITLLGRQSDDHTPTTITMNNDVIAKPFGAADTPAPGATVISGSMTAFMWALTPDVDALAGNGDIEIGPGGGSVVLFIDGVAIGPATFNQCRGTMGNPVPGGVFCNDDIASLFGHLTPQPPFTIRTLNPTRFRNLDAGRGAIGARVVQTFSLRNGLHTLAWSVTDSAGRVEGVGSRYFTVLNANSTLSAITALLAADYAPAVSRGAAASLEAMPVSTRAISARLGFDPAAPIVPVSPDADGVTHVAMAADGRLEIRLPAHVRAGFLQTQGELRDLPVGSHLDLTTGVLTWTPTASFLGTYRFVFLVDDTRVIVDVRVNSR